MSPQDLKQIKALLKEELNGVATKKDLQGFSTRDDLQKFTTKKDIRILKKELEQKIDESAAYVIESVDKHKADREDVEKVEKRVDKIEKQLQSF